MELLLASVSLLLGLVLLVVAADLFVGAAEGLALRLGWSPAVIGAVVVGFGTSLPELVTSVVAAYGGEPDLAIGNAAGSNVANLTLILGLAVLVAPLARPSRSSGRDIVLAWLAGLVLLGLSLDGALGWVDGVVLLVALALALVWQVRTGRSEPLEVEVRAPVAGLVTRVVLGLVGVIGGAQLLVWGALELAVRYDVPTIVIGSVLVAIGTSLPELATAIASARRGQVEMLVGNLVGSNAFNALAVVGASALTGHLRGVPLFVDRAALAVVIAAAVVTFAVGLLFLRAPRIGRLTGAVLVLLYAVSVPALTRIS